MESTPLTNDAGQRALQSCPKRRGCLEPQLPGEGTFDDDVINGFRFLIAQEAGVACIEPMLSSSVRCPLSAANHQPEKQLDLERRPHLPNPDAAQNRPLRRHRPAQPLFRSSHRPQRRGTAQADRRKRSAEENPSCPAAAQRGTTATPLLQRPRQNPNPTNQPRRSSLLRLAICRCSFLSALWLRRAAAAGRRDERWEMRCKLHPYANPVGVCAPCLRDRLLALAAERAQAADASSDGGCGSSSCGGSPPAPLLHLPTRRHQHQHGHAEERAGAAFPRSVSPYVQHRRSDACAYATSSSSSGYHQHQPNLLFFRTPQVGPAAAAAAAFRAADEPGEETGGKRKQAAPRRSFLSAIFGGGRRHGREAEAGRKEPPRRSTSWLSAIIRRKRRPTDLPAAASFPAPPRAQQDEEPESPGGSSSSWWFPSPSLARQQQHRRRHGGGGAGAGASGDGISGFAVCLSPLVRPSSAGGRRRCQPPDPSTMGDSHRRHASAGGAASFGRNASRKLADMGRFR
ncbi:unnamed protein product [Miscanthus lutarioriparius]|uniref:Uncharacterized protein n=1 Tax=Miscanthus lutarioriparius TaxID=422564 RepID=A0A811MX12_9POAL|nr:unnamed protein product [Miscanthus lutarioriparius]